MSRWLGWIFACDGKDSCSAELATVSDDIEVAYIQLATAGWVPKQDLRSGRKWSLCPTHAHEAKGRAT